VNSIDEILKNRKLIMVTGKGGIGKTLVSCMLAKRAVAMGRRVLVVEQSSVEQVGPLLDFMTVAHEEQWKGALGVANFTAAGNFRDFISKQLMKSKLLDIVVSNKIVHSFFKAIPGFSELMLLGRIFYAVNLSPNQRPDLVIIDSYASGHFLSLMTTPDAVLQSGLVGPIVHHTTAVKKWLEDPAQCVAIYVAVPEELVISEALEFLPSLAQKSPVRIGGVIMNRCLPSIDRNEGAKVGATKPSTENSAELFMSGRQERQRLALEKYAQGKAGSDVLRDLPVWSLLELGAVLEPLDQETVDVFLRDHLGDKDDSSK
jgi:arsenite/tail-anchored protein-transporting ATPase